ncbi:hypothetical protein CEP51_016762 [Fusarium floridanum]|uniref:Uncharacterized protein n=1 Tax=Fusarium floridanum TaxID=1325733 RepID=A0A428NGE8_9HYPO|nr:hypothetical protein CEP51_016762 [Fusarium floridanum]
MKIGLWKSRAPRPNGYRPIEGLSYMAHEYSIGVLFKISPWPSPPILSNMPPTPTAPKPDPSESEQSDEVDSNRFLFSVIMNGLYKEPETLVAITGQPEQELRNWTSVEKPITKQISVLLL